MSFLVTPQAGDLWRPEIDQLGAETPELVTTVQPKDPFGDPTGPPVTTYQRIPGCAVWPRGADEASFRASTTTDELVMVAPVYETDIDATKQIRWRGRLFEVDGNPMPWTYLEGEYAGSQVNLIRSGG